MSCSQLFSNQCLVRQEESHVQSPAPDTVPVGGKLKELGF